MLMWNSPQDNESAVGDVESHSLDEFMLWKSNKNSKEVGHNQ